MLVISPHQQSRLRDRQLARFVERACAFLGGKYGDERLPPQASWEQVVRAAIAAGERKGIRSELGVLTLCELALAYGFGFATEQPWAAYILDRSEADEGERVQRLREYLA